MRLFIFIISSLLLSPSSNAAKLVLDKSALDEISNKGLFFDAHNHNGGVIPPLGVVNAEKFIYGEPLTLSELKMFWQSFINSDVVKEKILGNSLFSNGIKMYITCNEPMSYCSRSVDKDGCRQKLIDGISHLFSSTPLTSFSTAYGIRRNLVDIPSLPGRTSSAMRAHALLFELAKTKVDVVEMSRPSMGGYDTETGNTFDFLRYRKLTDDLRSKTPSAENQRFKKRLEELGLQVPRIKWLLMTHTTELGIVADANTATYGDGQCTVVPLARALKTDPKTGLYNVLVNFEDVVGVDVAGPETTCFTKNGMEKFMNLAETTYLAAVAKRREKSHQGKLVIRVHVGEGFPIINDQFLHSEMQACSAMKAYPKINYVYDRQEEVPLHRIEAQKNISYILDAIATLREQYKDLDDYIVIRLAHLTHIDNALAKRAQELGVSADVNLSSNVATSAWTVDPKLINTYLVAKGLTSPQVPDLLDALVKNGAPLGEIFDNHGLKWLLYHHVPVTLGSDGSGVEHSESMRKEYSMARELIDYWNKHDANFAKQNISIDELLQNQAKHYKAMGYSMP
jgi:hypothetical protein